MTSFGFCKTKYRTDVCSQVGETVSLAWAYGWQQRLNTFFLTINTFSLCLPLSPLIKYLPENIASRHEEHNLFLKQKQGLNQLYKRMFRKLSCKINALSPAKPPPLSQMFYHFTYFLILCFLAYFFLCSLSVTVLLTVKTQGFRTVIMPPASCKTLTHIDNF